MQDSAKAAAYENAKAMINGGMDLKNACLQAGINESTFRRWRQKDQGDSTSAATTTTDGGTEVTTAPLKAKSWTPPQLLEEHGLDPAGWEVLWVVPNRWGDPDSPLVQFKFKAVPKSSLLEVPVVERTPKPNPPAAADGQLLVIGDHHAPKADMDMHQAVLGYLDQVRPRWGVILGDILNADSISRHRSKPMIDEVNAGLKQGAQILEDYTTTSPDTEWVMIKGNHDVRIDNYLLDYARDAYGIAPEGVGKPALDLDRLLGLTKRGITLIDDDWNVAKYNITDSLTARHGYMTADSAPKQMLIKHARSQLQGHTHRLRVTYMTRHDPLDVRLHAEAGCSCIIEGGLGYADEPNWQNGCLMGHVWDDGDFSVVPVPFIPGHGLLAPDGNRY